MVGWRGRKHEKPYDDGPTAPLDLPAFEPTPPPPGLIAVRTSPSASGASGVSPVIGATAVPQIIVGSPSPATEPSVIGPNYRSLPFHPDVVIDGWSTEVMTLRGVSQRGHLHRYNGAPRQDDFAAHHLPDGRVIVIVADGVSQAPQSHIGSSTATRQAAEWLHCQLGKDTASTDWMGLLKSTAWALIERTQTLLELGAPDPMRAEEQLATTLVCAVIEPSGIATLRAHLVSVGDSVAWLLSAGQFVPVLGGKSIPASGIASSAVVGLPRVPTDVTPVVVEIAGNEVLLIGTDGIGDPLGTGQGGVGNLLREVFDQPKAPSLIEFAHAVDFSRETFDDDRTLVAVWPKREPPQQIPVKIQRPDTPSGLRPLR
jgi:serine/threonine protein phosphatase PrpC